MPCPFHTELKTADAGEQPDGAEASALARLRSILGVRCCSGHNPADSGARSLNSNRRETDWTTALGRYRPVTET